MFSYAPTQYLVPLGVLPSPPDWEQNGVCPRTRTLCAARLLGLGQIPFCKDCWIRSMWGPRALNIPE